MRNLFFAFLFILNTVCLNPVFAVHASPLKQETQDPAIFFYTQDAPPRFIVVDKKSQTLTLIEQRNGIKLLKNFTAATGKNPGNKRTRGDERTPEGVYFITKRHKDRAITVFGNRAFHLDYPNVFDTIAGRLGDGIYIHGTNRVLKPNSSNGCITLNNNDLEKLEPYLGVNDTPVIISETLLDPQLGSVVEVEKNSHHFQEILRALSFSPEEFPAEDITTLFFIRNGAQAIADIYYYKYLEQYTRYHMHKRVYLNPASTHNWPNVHTTEVKAGIPMILAFHPIKSSHKRENLE